MSTPEILKFITDLTPFGTIIVTVVGAAWIAITYFRSEKAAAIARLFESRRPFLELQLKLYTETAQIAGKIVVPGLPQNERQAAVRRFWELFWSELAVVEGDQVERAMVQVGQALRKMEQGEPLGVLEQAVLNLAHALRDDIMSEWGAHVGDRMSNIAAPSDNSP
jgi:hypothetical protein